MKRVLIAGFVAAVLAAPPPTFAQAKAKATNVPEIPYESVANFFKMPPNIYFGEGIGVATNSKGHVFVYTRSGDTRLFEFDQNGAFVREIGQGLYGFVFAHAVRVDKDDNVWVVDEGSNMVIKFNPQGRVVLTIGRRPEAVDELTNFTGQGAYSGANKPYSFNRPTDVAWDAQGDIFVSDGYGDSRVVKYDKNGRFIKSAGTRGNQPGQLNLPHTLAADAQGNIYIGDRSNARVQVWDNDLNFKAIYDTVGSPWAVCVSPGPHQYLFVSNSIPDNGDSRLAAQTGEIYKMELDGTIVGKFGKAGKALKEFSTVH
jgi:sugar lactone lactonase YvrE